MTMSALKISVVVPVYNTGMHIEHCIDSLVKQTLPDDAYEIIFVDDGSTDATPARLDEAAAEHANVSVVHTPNSGWPGRPRNIGIDRAQGEFIYFVDHDDWLGEEALERLHAYATANDSDIVIGKMAGHGRGIPKELFLHNRPDATLATDPLLSILTPHKLFRRALLDEHGIRFPEGKRRLEDHLFVLQAYFAARRISVLADYVCYHWYRHGANASSVRADPKIYYDSLRDVLDVVEANTEPGAFRDDLLRHWYRGKMLGTLSARSLLGTPERDRDVLFQEVRRLAAERFGPAVPAKLGAFNRVRAALLEADRLDLMVAMAQWELGLRAQGQLESIRWRDKALLVRYTAALVEESGVPAPFELRAKTPHWRLPDVIRDSGVVPAAATKVPRALPNTRVSLIVRSAETGAEFVLPGRTRWVGNHGSHRSMRFIGEARLDPATAAGGAAMDPGEWHLQVSVRGAGLSRTAAFPGVSGAPALSLVIGPSGFGGAAGEPGSCEPSSTDPRFTSARARGSRPSLHQVMLDPRFQRVESAARRRTEPLTGRAKQVARWARRSVRQLRGG